MYKIEKGVPITEIPGKPARYPFKDMLVGDSFLVPKGHDVSYASVRASVSRYSAYNGTKYVTRKTKEGLRVWRVK